MIVRILIAQKSLETNHQTGPRLGGVVRQHDLVIVDIVAHIIGYDNTGNHHRLGDLLCIGRSTRVVHREIQSIADLLDVGFNRRRTALVLLDGDRSLLRYGNALDITRGGQRDRSLALGLGRGERERKLRRARLARQGARRAPCLIVRLVEGQGPVTLRNDLDGLLDLTSGERPCNSGRPPPIDGDLGNTLVTAVIRVVVRACGEGSNRHRRAEQRFPETHLSHRA